CVRNGNAGRRRAHLPRRGREARCGRGLPPIEPRGAAHRLDPRGRTRLCRRHDARDRVQRRRADAHVACAARRDQRRQCAGDRVSHLQRPRARRVSPPFLAVAGGESRDGGIGRARLRARDRRAGPRPRQEGVMAATHKTQVGIVGAGPAGLLLSHLLHRAGIDSIVVESRDRDYIEHRVRAGVLEQGTVDLLVESGVGQRLQREGLTHHGIELRFGGRGHRIDFTELTGRSIVVYGQQEVVKDLIRARIEADGKILFNVTDVTLHDIASDAPRLHVTHNGERTEIACDILAGCDGFHGVCRQSIPPGVLSLFERVYPFAWLGILAKAPPTHAELIYAYHERGFALYSMRSPEITRLYVQVAPDEDIVSWPDGKIGHE